MSRFKEDMHFYSNACHVCRVYGNKVQLKRCAGCKTIAYCSKEHQSKHWPRHKDLCKLLTGIVQQAGTTLGAQDSRELSTESWTRVKTNLMLLVQIKMGRKLEPYETEMFKFPRACTVCHETESHKLIDCPDCPAASFCADHQRTNAHATTKCSTLKLCFDIETAQVPFLPVNPKIFSFGQQEENIPKTMEELVDLYVSRENGHNSMSPKMVGAWISEYLTRPLTFLYALRRINGPKLARANVHVIGANAIEIDSLAYWETVLHCDQSLTRLELVLVGPELAERAYQMHLCEDCTAKNAKIHIRSVSMLYADYVASKQFAEPDFVIGFNLGIHECEQVFCINDTWAQSLRALAQQDCPFFMTSYTMRESQEERKRLRYILHNSLEFSSSEKNPFSSLRPYRDFESEDFFYQNNYITIYKKLC